MNNYGTILLNILLVKTKNDKIKMTLILLNKQLSLLILIFFLELFKFHIASAIKLIFKVDKDYLKYYYSTLIA